MALSALSAGAALCIRLAALTCGAAFVAVAAAAAAQALAQLPSPTLPEFTNAAQVKASCDRELAVAAGAVKKLESQTVDNQWLSKLDALRARIEDGYRPVEFLSNVHPSAPVRDAIQPCLTRWGEFLTTLALNPRIYQAVLKAPAADDIDREFIRATREALEDAGMSLPLAQRAKAKTLNEFIGAAAATFEKNIRDANIRVVFTEAELRGVPLTIWKDANRDAQGRVVLGVDMPTYQGVMQGAEDTAARERMWRAKVNVGADVNMALLKVLATLRRELAGMFGYSSYADFSLRRTMAKTAARIQAFLDDVKSTVAASELRELAELKAAKAAHVGLPLEATRIEPWDQNFYQERLKRERFQVDEEAFRPYFPPQDSLRFVMRLAEQLFDIRYVPVNVKTWHPDVQAYAVEDASTGAALGSLYVDLYPREGKYNHAAVWQVRGSRAGPRLAQASTAALVANFNRDGLSLDELETLLHEFGHTLHINLSQTRYAAQAGTSVLSDFAEAPSQMLEDWVYEPAVIATMQSVCPTCKPVPAELLKQARAAKRMGEGNSYAVQHLLASYDLALYSQDVRDPGELWAAMEGATPIGHVPGTRFVAGFAHIAGGYAAGYYGYLWSEVVAMDLRTAFAADRLSPTVGRRYRDTVLSQGSQRPPDVLLRNFLGRETSSQAFFEHLRR